MEDVPDLSSDEECFQEDEWEEMEESDSVLECLFCKETFSNITSAFSHCKIEHNFDISSLKIKHDMDFYSYIKLITYIRTTNADAASITGAAKPLWLDDAYLKPVRQEDWLTFDFDSLNEEVQEPKQGFHANVENGLVTLSEAHFTELQRTIQSLTAKLNEAHNCLALSKDDMETMKKSMQNIMSDGGGDVSNDPAVVLNCVGKVNIEDDQGYFNSYAHFGIHHDMLFDKVRTESYKSAILDNPDVMKDKTVMDLGCGTGILSMFVATAGASQVIAIDQSDIVYNAMDIVRENNLQDKIKIIKGRLEDTKLPDKVDIIVSEWMGYFLLFEGMLDSFIYARDNYLKPGGLLLPNKCNISLVGSGDSETHHRFISCWSDVYGYKMNCMKSEVIREASIDIANPEHLITTPHELCNIDLTTCTTETVNFSSEFKLNVLRDGNLSFFVGYFDTFFDLPKPVTFSTGPQAIPTHWKQTVFYLKDPIPVKKDDCLTGTLICSRNTSDIRGLVVQIIMLGKTYKYILG